jgi:putative transposase
MLHALHPDTVVRWHRQGFRFHWRWKSRSPKPGRPRVDTEIRKLIRQMQSANVGWGAPATARLESMVNYTSWV